MKVWEKWWTLREPGRSIPFPHPYVALMHFFSQPVPELNPFIIK